MLKSVLTLALVISAFLSLATISAAQSLPPESEFIIGPQAPLSNTWFDQTQIDRARFHGQAFPATPPSPLTDAYILTHYYDLGLTEYIAYKRTGDPVFLEYARKVNDSWWLSDFVQEGRLRNFDQSGPAPRHAGIAGLILRALDGRPEMWDWITAYTRYHFNLWITMRLNDTELYLGVRESGFMLHYATLLAKVHPDPAIRAEFLGRVENAAVNYFGRLQYPDGSWRWDDPYYVDSDGGTLKSITQPFMVGLLLNALIDVHRLTENPLVKLSTANQIVAGCRHLYFGGPYRKDEPVPVDPNKTWRAFWYFYHGGTTVNPSRYENGGGSEPGTLLWHVGNERQATSTIFSAFGYAYLLTGDLALKLAGDELVDATFVGSDGIRGFAADTAKSYNQTYRMGGRYFGWMFQSGNQPEPTPLPSPSPSPVVTPSTTPTPSNPSESPDGTVGETVTDSTGALWTIGSRQETLRNGLHVGNGSGTRYAYVNRTVYVEGLPSGWYKWTGSVWEGIPGSPVPSPSPTPEPTPEPSPSPSPLPAPQCVKFNPKGKCLKWAL